MRCPHFHVFTGRPRKGKAGEEPNDDFYLEPDGRLPADTRAHCSAFCCRRLLSSCGRGGRGDPNIGVGGIVGGGVGMCRPSSSWSPFAMLLLGAIRVLHDMNVAMSFFGFALFFGLKRVKMRMCTLVLKSSSSSSSSSPLSLLSSPIHSPTPLSS